MTYHCPGADNIRTPTLETKVCPVCGGDIDLFSIDMQGVCDKCGFVAYNDTKTCIKWCKYARECVGDDLYEHMMKNMEGLHGTYEQDYDKQGYESDAELQWDGRSPHKPRA